MGRTIAVRRDDGFSVVEVVVAAAILFFVLTAVVGLVGVSSAMTVQAKQKSVLTNAVASYVDEVRAYSWEDIAATDSDGDSVFVPASSTRVVEGVTVTFATSVENRQVLGDEYMKNLRITATAVLGGQTQTYTTRVAIRNPSFNRTLSVDPDVPTITFESGTPEENEVLYVNSRLAGGVIRIRTRAESPVGTVTQVRYEVAGRLLRDQLGGGGNDALFEPNPPVATVANESYWDTRQDGVLDGLQTIVATVEDDQGRAGNVRRQYIIDNFSPLTPGTPTLAPTGSRTLGAQWPAARDGGTDAAPFFASQYQWELSKDSTVGITPLGSWPRVASSIVPAGATYLEAVQAGGSFAANVSAPATVTPFGRYWLRVTSGSPRGIGTAYSDSAVVVTRPEIYCLNTPAPFNFVSSVATTTIKSTGNPKYCDYTVTLFISKPSFPTSALSVANIQYSTDNVTWVNVVPGGRTSISAPVTTDARFLQQSFVYSESGSTARQLYFRALVNVTPTGGTAVTLPTNSVGRTATTTGTKVNLDPYGFQP